MARHGENIRKRKDGRWEGRYPAYSKEKGRKLYRSVYGKSYREAKEKLMVQKSRISDSLWENPAKLTDAQIASYGNTDVNAGNGMWENTDTNAKNTAGKNMGENVAAVCGNIAVVYGNVAAACGNAAVYGNVTTACGNIVTICQNVDTKPIEIKNGTGGEENRNRTETENRNKAELLEFSSVAKEWLNAVKALKKPSTYVKYRMVFENHLEPLFQNTKLSMVTDPFVREKISDPLSESMGKSIYCVLNQVLKFAGEQYAVIIPPVKRPVSCLRKKPVEVFSRKEQSRLLSALYHNTDRFKAAVLLCLHTGLRLGELCALKWGDIDQENRSISVGRTVQRLYREDYMKDCTKDCTEDYAEVGKSRQTKTALLETTPKSLHSQREIPLPLEFFGLLTKGFKEKKGNEYIFGGNRPVEPRTMQNRFKKILKEAGVENKKFHTLRHTFSTNCIEGGTDAKSLSEILGHADVQLTLNRYVHPSMDIKRRHLDTLSSFYSRICGQLDVQICG